MTKRLSPVEQRIVKFLRDELKKETMFRTSGDWSRGRLAGLRKALRLIVSGQAGSIHTGKINP